MFHVDCNTRAIHFHYEKLEAFELCEQKVTISLIRTIDTITDALIGKVYIRIQLFIDCKVQKMSSYWFVKIQNPR